MVQEPEYIMLKVIFFQVQGVEWFNELFNHFRAPFPISLKNWGGDGSLFNYFLSPNDSLEKFV